MVDNHNLILEINIGYCPVSYTHLLTNNRRIDPVEFENTMLMHLHGDDMDRLREEYNQIVRERTEWSNNIFREKYVVLSVQRRSIEEMCIRDSTGSGPIGAAIRV